MNLVLDMHNNILVKTRFNGEVTPLELLRAVIEKSGKSTHRVEEESGFTHPRLCAINSPTRPSKPGIETILIALIELGYKVKLEKESA